MTELLLLHYYVSKPLLWLLNIYRRNTNGRRMLASAVYYHAQFSVRLFDVHLKKFDEVERQIIAEGSTYTPFMVESPDNDLTYNQIIEVMVWLKNKKERETILWYYHNQMAFHAHSLSFNTNIVRNCLSQERKCTLLRRCKDLAEEASRYAKDTMKILERRLPELRRS